jgi:hypothetical protein
MDNFLEEFKKLKEKVEALEKRTLSSLKLDSLTTKIISLGVSTKNTNYTMTASDCVILANASAGEITITLPPANKSGMIVHVKKVDSSANVVNISSAGTDTIEGATTVSLLLQYSSRTLISNGEGMWLVLSSS